MKSEQRVDERRLAGAVWTEQTNGFATQVTAKVLQNLPATERDAETLKIDHRQLWIKPFDFSSVRSEPKQGECHTLLIALCLDNSK